MITDTKYSFFFYSFLYFIFIIIIIIIAADPSVSCEMHCRGIRVFALKYANWRSRGAISFRSGDAQSDVIICLRQLDGDIIVIVH